jgi:HD-GYP domain-containing protein (c-di-GMP phosphodiesterase class II)
MRPALRAYILGVTGLGLFVLAAALLLDRPTLDVHEGIVAAFTFGLMALASVTPVKLAPKRTMSTYAAVMMVAVLTLSPSEAAIVCAVGCSVGSIQARRPWFNVLFNAVQHGLTVLVAAAGYYLIAPVSLAEPGHDLRGLLAIIPAGALLYLISALAVDIAAAIQQRRTPFQNWWTVRQPTMGPHVLLVVVGAAAATAVERLPFLMVFMVVPVLAVRWMLAASIQFDAETIGLAEQIADAVDAQHPELRCKSRQVADIAGRMARAMDLPAEQAQRIYLACRLHDVAIAVAPWHVALELEVVDEEQRAYLDTHAEDAAEYVARVLNLPTVAEVLRFHHERWDGKGYPRSARGVDIPLESRILAAADMWVALTSQRVYRPALDEEQALRLMEAGAESKWGPDVVAALTAAVRAPRPSDSRDSVAAGIGALVRGQALLRATA